MKYFKRTLAWLLSVCMVLSIFTINNIVAKADGTVRLEFMGAQRVEGQNAVKYTIDSKEWTITISSVSESLTWDMTKANPELTFVAGTALTFSLSGGDAETPKPSLSIGGESMNFSEGSIPKAFDTAGGPTMIELKSNSGGGGSSTPSYASLEFRDGTREGNAIKYTIDGNVWTVTISGLESFSWKDGGSNPELENIPEGTSLTFTLSGDAIDDSSIPKPKMNFGGESMNFSDDNRITKSFNASSGPIQVQLTAGGTTPPGPDGPGGEDNPPAGQQEDVNLTVSWSGSFGEIKVGGKGVDLSKSSEKFTRLNVNEGKIDISLQAEPTIEFTSIKIDGAEKLSDGQTEDYYTFQIPKETTNVSIAVVTAQSDTYTIQWSYDDIFGDDAKVENGTVEMVSGYKTGANTYWQAESGSIVRVKLVPDYGYQVIGAKINGVVDLVAEDESNEFTFEMPSTHVHFKGIFTKTSDIVENSSSAVSGASFDGSNVATTGGTAKMTIANATPASTASVSGVDTTKSVQAVDITMDQLFYKNTASNVWSTNKTELSSPAEVSLTVNQAADGYTVLRTHNGAVEEIPASYDPATNKITFASNKYSTYTLVPLKKSNNTYVPETKDEEAKKPVIVEEVIKDVKQVTADKTALALQTEQLIPTTTFNFSSVKTFKGFVTSVEKASQKTLQADSKAKVVSIYTNKPFCFNRNILEAMRKTNQTFVYYFMYKNHLYSVTVPAGTDPSKVLEKNGCAGPLYIGKVLGTTVLIK